MACPQLVQAILDNPCVPLQPLFFAIAHQHSLPLPRPAQLPAVSQMGHAHSRLQAIVHVIPSV